MMMMYAMMNRDVFRADDDDDDDEIVFEIRSIGRLTTMFFQRSGSSSSSSRSGLFRLLPNRPSVARSGCDERRLPTPPPSFLEHHKTLNSKKDIQICLRISPIYLPSPLSPPRAHKRHRSTIASSPSSSHYHSRPPIIIIIIIMVRDVDNHGHKIWRPFSALDASTTPTPTSLALDGDRLMLSNARQIEFVLHKNIVNSVRAFFFSSLCCWRFTCWFWTDTFFPLLHRNTSKTLWCRRMTSTT